MEQRQPQYQIAKITYEGRVCCVCKGKKTLEVNMGNKQYKTVQCSTCCGTGVYEHMYTEYIDIRQAMNEIGIRRMIENTVKEILENSH